MNAQNLLAVDTSSRVLSIAISTGAALYEANLEGTPRHSEQLIDLIQEGLKHLRLKKNELNGFLWGLGPGSFTGLRIGLSILKGFHLGFKKRSFGASSLDLIALGSRITSGELAVCVDARRERIYTALYRFRDGKPEKMLRDSILSLDELVRKLSPETILTGDAITTYGDLIRKKVSQNILCLEPSFWYPHANFLIHLWKDQRSWLRSLTLKNMTPQYLRLSEAEEKLGRNKKKR
ncbi:MAG: tRNA (adenosine(37)-N6)-threonylcarbamoyltransferase complex dimerization subunit type 1 TsaB [Candidatus Omnitrophica bacterium]|nr:tRNA (adenosine(37)-N6)-threonylcarbamoyltransferase complex dimerization subunit type 1 TsaB [Candidatus Omnitrophota bacterium]